MACNFPGWGVSKQDGVLVNGMWIYISGRGVSIWDAVLVNGIECYYME